MKKEDIVYSLCEYLFRHRDRRHVVLEIAESIGLKDEVDKAAIESVAMPGWLLTKRSEDYTDMYKHNTNNNWITNFKITKLESNDINSHHFNWDPSKYSSDGKINEQICHCGFRLKLYNYSSLRSLKVSIDDGFIANEEYVSGDIFPCKWSVRECLQYRIGHNVIKDIIE